MKRIIAIVCTLILILGLSQCKKKPVVVDNGPEPVSITLDVNDGSKVLVNTGTGEVNFQSGDVLYVAYNGVYVGALTHNGIRFKGQIYATIDPKNNHPLCFYFLGNKTPYETLSIGSTTSLSVDIIDQTSTLPVISAAVSREVFTGAGSYHATLENKCALVKFNVTTPSISPIYITGMHNKMRVDFATNDVGKFIPIKAGSGAIKLSACSGAGSTEEKWAILLEQKSLPAGGAETAYSSDWNYTGTRGAVPEIGINGYITSGVNVIVDNTEHQGQLSGVFSVGVTKKVKISRGNLRYHTTTKQWSFHEKQCDMVHNAVVDDISGEYADGSGYYIDLFGWGTSGYNHGAICYQPYSISGVVNDYYVYGSSSLNLYDSNGSADWGKNAISNGGGVEGIWRSLTNAEWNYLLNERGGYMYAKGKLNGFPGLIIFPDDWDSELYSINNANNNTVNYNSNKISMNQWDDVFETNGAVFLPAAGYRNVIEIGGVQVDGNYWSSSVYDDTYTFSLTFSSSTLSALTAATRGGGRSVRLVCDVAAE